jgi:hypothetical protein
MSGPAFPWCIRRCGQGVIGALLGLLLLATSGRTEALRGNPAARLLSGEFASEHWEFTARFDSGHLLFAEFIITNIGFGDRNAAATGYVVDPDGKLHRFRNGRREGKWTLSPDRLRLQIGSSTLDFSRLPYRLQVGKRNIRIDLRFRPERGAIWTGNPAPVGYTLELLDAAAPIEGSIWVQGMEQPLTVAGVVAVTHSWMNELGSSLVLRRTEFFSLQGDCPVYSVEVVAPDKTHTQWLVVRQAGALLRESQGVAFSLDGGTKKTSTRNYPIPQSLRFHSAEIDGQVQLGRLMLHYDPLGDLPQPFRFFVSLLLNLRPQRVWALSPFEVEVAFRPEEAALAQCSQSIRGTGVTAITFLNPMPAS